MRHIIKERINPACAKHDYDPAYILALALDIGEEMLISGGEVNRIETTIARILHTYDYEKLNVFALPGYISVSLLTPEGEVLNQSRRIYSFNNNMAHLEALNELSRYICSNKPTVATIYQLLEDIPMLVYPKDTLIMTLAYFLGAGGFTLFFGGNLIDALAAGIIGIVIFFLNRFSKIQRMNRVVYTLLTSCFAGILAVLFCFIGLGRHLDMVVIGDIMLLVPGAMLTIAVRDMLCGDIIAGVFRAIESILIGGAIGAGYAISLFLLGGLL